jgi:hypothetical protein
MKLLYSVSMLRCACVFEVIGCVPSCCVILRVLFSNATVQQFNRKLQYNIKVATVATISKFRTRPRWLPNVWCTFTDALDRPYLSVLRLQWGWYRDKKKLNFMVRIQNKIIREPFENVAVFKSLVRMYSYFHLKCKLLSGHPSSSVQQTAIIRCVAVLYRMWTRHFIIRMN